MPSTPIVFGHVYLGHFKDTLLQASDSIEPHLICYNDRLCHGFSPNNGLFSFNNMTCRRLEDFPLSFRTDDKPPGLSFYVTELYKNFYQCNTFIYGDPLICNHPIMYKCINSSKCITTSQLCNGIIDCHYQDDEQCSLIDGRCSVIESDLLFKCRSTRKCISVYLFNDNRCDCGWSSNNFCDDEPTYTEHVSKHIFFPIVCDGFVEVGTIIINNRNETDETECEFWQCNNTYTRCDNIWNCFDGADEIDCHVSLLLERPLHHYLCVSPDTFNLTCVPMIKTNDGIIDCVGATDQPKLCRLDNYHTNEKNFYCKNDTIQLCTPFRDLCSQEQGRIYENDTHLCSQPEVDSDCDSDDAVHCSDIQQFL